MGDVLQLPNPTICRRSLCRFTTQGLQRLSNQNRKTSINKPWTIKTQNQNTAIAKTALTKATAVDVTAEAIMKKVKHKFILNSNIVESPAAWWGFFLCLDTIYVFRFVVSGSGGF